MSPPLAEVKVARIASVAFFLASQLKHQVEYLRDIGMRVSLVCAHGPELSRIALDRNLRHVSLSIGRTLNPLKDVAVLFQLIQLFRKENYQIVHSTTPKAGLITALAAWMAHVPIRLHTFTGQRWVTLKGPLRFFARQADRMIGLLNTRCYADSVSQRQFLIDEGLIPEAKIGVIGAGSLAGVDLGRFNPASWDSTQKEQLRKSLSCPPSSQIIIFIGRITRDKGILELLSAFKELQGKYDIDLLLVGPLDEECGGKASIPVEQLLATPRVHHVGYTSTPENYLAIADILCLPSYREGFGTVVIEAAAMGVPTIGTDINGLKDAVSDGETGLLVPPQNSIALYEALKRLLESPDIKERMKNAARRRCEQLFDAAIINQQLSTEYLRLLKRNV